MTTSAQRKTIRGYVSAESFGINSDSEEDQGALIRTAATTCATLGAVLRFGKGTYRCSPDGTNPWYLDLPDGAVLEGVPNHTVIGPSQGADTTARSFLRLNGLSNVTIRGIHFEGAWGNYASRITADSDGAALPQATIYVESTDDAPSAGTFDVVTAAGTTTTITYTGKTAGSNPSFTGCTGGTGTLAVDMRVGRLDGATGINHSNQADPRNHAIMIRGCSNVTIENCRFTNIYGDAIWLGYRGDPIEDVNTVCRNIKIYGCVVRTTARNGISIGQAVDGVRIRDCDIRDVYATAIDMEPQTSNQYARDVVIDGCTLDGWWNPGNATRTLNQVLSISGGLGGLGLSDAGAARGIRVRNNTIRGSTGLNGARGVVLDGNHHIIDFDHGAAGGVSYAALFVDHTCDDAAILNSDFYDRGKFVDGYSAAVNPHGGVITVQSYGLYQPAGVRIIGNRIRSRGPNGIQLSGLGGLAQSAGGYAYTAQEYTATSVTSSTVVVTGAGWTSNQWAGWNVQRSGKVAVVESNTSDTLTLAVRSPSGGGWNAPFGGSGTAASAPTAGAFTLSVPTGVCVVEGNSIDCGDDGNGAGGYGIALYGEQSGGRYRIRANNVKNATQYGIYCNFSALTVTPLLEVTGNRADDDQVTGTCNATVHFLNGTAGVDRLIVSGNTKGGNVRTVTSGLLSGHWLVEDGDQQRFRGYGSPEGVVKAQTGSEFMRRNGGAGTTLYVKEASGTAIDAQDGSATSGVSVASGGTINALPTITTTVDACLVVLALAAQPGSGSGDFDTYTNAALSSITEIDNNTLAGCVGVVTAVKATAGAVGTTSARNNGAQPVYGPTGITLALAPSTPGITPDYVGAGTRQTRTTSGVMTVARPTSGETVDGADLIEGDYELLIVEALEADTISLTTAAGFTEITSSPKVGAWPGGVGSQLHIYERRVVSSADSSPQITFTAVGTPAHAQARIYAFRGAALADAVGWSAK